MIKRLRRKFVAGSMALVAVILVTVFSALCITECNRAIANTDSALAQAMSTQGFMYARPIIDRVDDTSTTSRWFTRSAGEVFNALDENGNLVSVSIVPGANGRPIAVWSKDIIVAGETDPDDSAGIAISQSPVLEPTEETVTITGSLNLQAVMAQQPENYFAYSELPGTVIGTGSRPSSIPSFWVIADAEGNLLNSMLDSVEITEDVVQAALREALSAESDTGVLNDFALKYLRESTDSFTKVAFADITTQNTTIRNSVLTTLAAFLGTLAAFFFVCLILSSWVIRPVERSWNDQRRFIADASHELKTPLTVILANTGILLEHGDETITAHEKWISSTRYEAMRMKGLIENMLYLARGDSDAEQSHEGTDAAFSMSDIVWNEVLSFEPVAYEQGKELSSDIAPEIEVRGDSAAVGKLVSLLLDNAVKYAGANGSVDVTLTAERLTVHNTGDPIPPEALPHIFERFYRADPARPEGGHGLGLAIAKAIADSNHINLTARSDESGTVFTAEF